MRRPVVHDVAADGDGVVEALVALDELLDRDGVGVPEGDECRVELGVVVDAGRTQRAGAGPRFEDQRVPDVAAELPGLVGGVDRSRRGRGNPGLTQGLLHRRLVAAQPGRADGGAGYAAPLADPGGGHLVRLDRRLEPVHPHLFLSPLDRRVQLVLVGDVGDLVVRPHLPAQLVAQSPLGGLTHPDHAGSHARQRGDEPALVVREGRLDEDDVHGREPSGGSPSGRGTPTSYAGGVEATSSRRGSAGGGAQGATGRQTWRPRVTRRYAAAAAVTAAMIA